MRPTLLSSSAWRAVLGCVPESSFHGTTNSRTRIPTSARQKHRAHSSTRSLGAARDQPKARPPHKWPEPTSAWSGAAALPVSVSVHQEQCQLEKDLSSTQARLIEQS